MSRAAGAPAALTTLWATLRAPELRPPERLFFECYARAAQGEAPFSRLLPGAVDAWLDAVGKRAADSASALTLRLGLAVTRGLLLDLVATENEQAVDLAFERFLASLRAAGITQEALR